MAFFAWLALGAAACSRDESSALPAGRIGLRPAATVARLPARRGSATCTPFPYPAPGLPPACTIYVGGFISPTHGETPAQQIASTRTFERQIGRNLAMNLHYFQWTDSFPSVGEADDLQNGRIPLDSWHCGATDYDIASGVWDSLIAKRAAAMAAYPGPIFLRWKWEMNLTYNPRCADRVHDPKIGGHVQYNPEYFQEAWDHIRAIFVANGAGNVIWVFNPSSSGVFPGPYYPGDGEVDWIGFDHYDQQGLDFSEAFSQVKKATGGDFHTYPYFVKTFPNKPLMVGETGATIAYQQRFLNDADSALQTQFPNIQAVMYWDSTGVRGQYQLGQFGIEQYAQFASGPYEQGFYR